MGKIIGKIVLTGGPCGGKTSVLSKIEENLTELGFHIIVVPESATEIIKSGIKPFGDYKIDMLDFQRLILDHQLLKEKVFESAVNFYPKDDKFIIIYDRGVLDNKAYINQELFNQLLNEKGLKELDLMDHYDMVLHLVTAASVSYTLDNNSARSESAEQAIELDAKTLNAWLGHTNLKVINCTETFEEKIQNVLNEVNNLIGNPITIKTQRRYLIDLEKSNIAFDKIESPTRIEITQTYLKSNDGLERRLKKRTYDGCNTYFITKKRKNSNGIEEILSNKKISEKDYCHYLEEDAVEGSISFVRYSFTANRQYYKLDVFEDGKAILEVLPTLENKTVMIPEGICVIEDVTDNPLYSTSALAQKSRVKKLTLQEAV